MKNKKSMFTTTHVLSALSIALVLSLGLNNYVVAGDGHDHDKPEIQQAPNAHADEEVHTEALKLTVEQMQLAGIKVVSMNDESLNLNRLDVQHTATASLVVNRNQTAVIDPQLDVRVLKRHIVPGKEITKGEVLLTLGGSEVAQAQADYINAAKEWDRVRRLSKNAVSESKRQQTEVEAQLKKAILQSINMTKSQIAQLKTSPQLVGSFDLLAPITGRIQQDASKVGQINTAGTPLLQLTDESSLWVEAELTPVQSKDLSPNRNAVIKVGDTVLGVTLIGRSHEFDKETRTEEVLFKVENPKHILHAGQFAELYFSAKDGSASKGIVLPDAALTRSGDGDWQIFIKDEDGFEAMEVEIKERQQGLNLVTSPELEHAKAENVHVIVEGAFFLASEQAKSGFDIHAH